MAVLEMLVITLPMVDEPIPVPKVAMVLQAGMVRLDPMGKTHGQRGKVEAMAATVVEGAMEKQVETVRMPPVSAGTGAMVDTAPLAVTGLMAVTVAMATLETTLDMELTVNVELTDQICISPSNRSILPFIPMKPWSIQKSSLG